MSETTLDQEATPIRCSRCGKWNPSVNRFYRFYSNEKTVNICDSCLRNLVFEENNKVEHACNCKISEDMLDTIRVRQSNWIRMNIASDIIRLMTSGREYGVIDYEWEDAMRYLAEMKKTMINYNDIWANNREQGCCSKNGDIEV